LKLSRLSAERTDCAYEPEMIIIRCP